jgi:hypothetical protein
MNRHLHNSDEIYNSAQHGWEQMKFLLDKNLPASNKKNSRQLYMTFTITASLTAIFLFSSLILKNNHHQNLLSNHLSNSAASQPLMNKINQHSHTEIYAVSSRKSLKIKTQHSSVPPLNFSEKEEVVHSETQSNTRLLTLAKITFDQTNDHDIKQLTENLEAQNKRAKMHEHVSANDSLNSNSVSINNKVKIRDNENNWNLSLGLGVNGMIGQRQNVQPYPVTEAHYNISPRFYMAIGLSIGSPASTDSYGISKTVYLNDTANNVQLYNKVTTYNRLNYADIPLIAGINISKRLSIRGGAQVSFLLNTKNTISMEKYDFQMRLSNSLPITPSFGTAAAIEKNYTVNESKIDCRITTGFQYSISKTSFNLMYQYSVKPMLTGDYVVSKKSQLITFNVLYRLK